MKQKKSSDSKLIITNCPDCGTAPGMPHVPGCDVERCSVCGNQKIQCNHSDHDPLFARWTGIYPGEAEAKYLGMDLNEFVKEGYYRRFFTKPSQNVSIAVEKMKSIGINSFQVFAAHVNRKGILFQNQYYYSEELQEHFTERVRFIYFPSDTSSIRVYDINANFICVAHRVNSSERIIKK